MSEAQDQLDLMSNSLGRAADDAQAQAAASGHLRAELERRTAALADARAKLDATRLRLQLEGQQLGNLQQKVGGAEWGIGGHTEHMTEACSVAPMQRSAQQDVAVTYHRPITCCLQHGPAGPAAGGAARRGGQACPGA